MFVVLCNDTERSPSSAPQQIRFQPNDTSADEIKRFKKLNAHAKRGCETLNEAVSMLALHCGYSLGAASAQGRRIPDFKVPWHWTLDHFDRPDDSTWRIELGYLQYTIKEVP